MAERIEEDPGNFLYPNAALHCVSLRRVTLNGDRS